jgi:hypothetical protein
MSKDGRLWPRLSRLRTVCTEAVPPYTYASFLRYHAKLVAMGLIPAPAPNALPSDTALTAEMWSQHYNTGESNNALLIGVSATLPDGSATFQWMSTRFGHWIPTPLVWISQPEIFHLSVEGKNFVLRGFNGQLSNSLANLRVNKLYGVKFSNIYEGVIVVCCVGLPVG